MLYFQAHMSNIILIDEICRLTISQNNFIHTVLYLNATYFLFLITIISVRHSLQIQHRALFLLFRFALFSFLLTYNY